MTIRRMRIAYWIPKATNTHSEYVTFIAFPLQQLSHERASKLHYVYIACLVVYVKARVLLGGNLECKLFGYGQTLGSL
jgi:hypothetical protein